MEDKDELRRAYKGERDGSLKIRLLGVLNVLFLGRAVADTAVALACAENSVYNRAQGYGEGGIAALRDLPRSGRPPPMSHKGMERAVKKCIRDGGGKTAPAALYRHVPDACGIGFHMTYMRKILHGCLMTPKAAQHIPANHAPAGSVSKWQSRLHRRISRLIRDGFAIAAPGEAFLAYGSKGGRKYRSPAGTRIKIPYIGRHLRTAVYGAVLVDGRQLFRLYGKFDGPTFLKYAKELHARSGKAVILCDRAPPHRTTKLKEYVRKMNGQVVVIYLPRGSPYPSPAGECWNLGKRLLLVSEHYKSFAYMCAAVSLYYRTARFRLVLLAYLNRSPYRFLKDF